MKYFLLPLGAIIFILAFQMGQHSGKDFAVKMFIERNKDILMAVKLQGFKEGQYSIVLTALNNGQLVASR